jgi:hypothetical protein
MGVVPPKVKTIILLLTFGLMAARALAWTDGELLVWMVRPPTVKPPFRQLSRKPQRICVNVDSARIMSE